MKTDGDERVYAELGRRIRACREARRMTQGQLGESVGKTARTIERYESGEQAPSLALAYRMADAMSVSIGKLVTPTSSWKR